jgi:hypothetical protein
LSVCVLSKREVGRLVNYGHQPNHNEHRHLNIQEAAVLLANDTLRVVDNGSRECVTEQDSNNRRWRGRPSGGMQVLQLVPVA